MDKFMQQMREAFANEALWKEFQTGIWDTIYSTVAATLVACVLGIILGNVSPWFKQTLSAGVTPSIIVVGFALGCGMSIQQLFQGGLSGILLGVICVAWSGLFCILADKFILKRPGYAGAALSSAAGNCVATPAAVAVAAPAFEPYVESATAQCAAAVIVTVLLVPLVTTWAAKKWGTAAEWEAKKAAKAGHT